MFDVVDDLAGAVKGVQALDADGLTDDELSEALVALRRQMAALEAATTRLTGVWDARGVWALDGHRSGAAWLAFKTRESNPAARRQVRLARETRTMPAAGRRGARGPDRRHIEAPPTRRPGEDPPPRGSRS